MACTWICHPAPSSAAARLSSLEERGGARLDHAVLVQLRRDGPDPRRGVERAPVPQPVDQAVDAGGVRLGIDGRDDANGQCFRAVRRCVGAEITLGGPRLECGGDAGLVGQSLRPGQAPGQLGIGPLGQETGHQIHGALTERPARLAGAGIALDPPVRGIGRVASDPGEGERLAVRPGGVAVRGVEDRGPVRDDSIEEGSGGVGVGEDRQLPADASHPRRGGSGRSARTDRIRDRRGAFDGEQGALAQLHSITTTSISLAAADSGGKQMETPREAAHQRVAPESGPTGRRSRS